MSNKFKNASGARYLRGLFFETTLEDKSSVVYTLKNFDHLGYQSLYRLYMETGDPTEYKFATQYLDGWDHWEALCGCSWFKPYVEAWRRELEVKVRSAALAQIEQVSHLDGDTKTKALAFTANKYLLDGGWKPKGEGKVGRPTKEAIKKEAFRITQEAQDINEDYNRIFGKAN